MLNQLFQRLRGVRHLEWILAIFAVAALLIFVAGLSDGQPAENVSSLEARLERVLSAVEGAGEVRVMINEPEAAQAAFMSQDHGVQPLMFNPWFLEIWDRIRCVGMYSA